MAGIGLILLVLAFLLAGIAAFLAETMRGVNLGWLALAIYFLSILLGHG